MTWVDIVPDQKLKQMETFHRLDAKIQAFIFFFWKFKRWFSIHASKEKSASPCKSQASYRQVSPQMQSHLNMIIK